MINSWHILATVIQYFPVILSVVIIIYFLINGRKTNVSYSFIICQVLIFIWSLGQIFVMNSTTKDRAFFYICIEYIAISLIGGCWLTFCLLYTGSNFVSKKKNIAYIFIVPVLVYLCFITNNYHHLFYKSFEFTEDGIVNPHNFVFWIHAAVSYAYIITGTWMLVVNTIRSKGYARNQSIFLILAVIIPLVSNVFNMIKIASGVSFSWEKKFMTVYSVKESFAAVWDLTPASFSVSLMLFAFVTFRYRFLNLIPIAYSKIVSNMKEAVVVVDRLNKINTYNTSFKDIFNKYLVNKKTDELQEFICYLNEISIDNTDDDWLDVNSINSELRIKIENLKSQVNNPENSTQIETYEIKSYQIKSYQLKIQPLKSRRGEDLGRIITLNDITDYVELLSQINLKNEELSRVNRQLQEYSEKVEELSVAKERNRFARDIHDTIGHSMAMIIRMLEVCKIDLHKNPQETEKLLTDAIGFTREGLKEVRRSIYGLIPGKFESKSFIEALKEMVYDFKSTGMEIDLDINGEVPNEVLGFSESIYRICQEALTNSFRHGKASFVSIVLRFEKEVVKLFIIDNGAGCNKINEGCGLTGMKERLEEINGKIVYGSDGETGFNIRVEIPVNVISY